MNKKKGKPFLKWAGDKTQLITDVEKNMPVFVLNKKFGFIEQSFGLVL